MLSSTRATARSLRARASSSIAHVHAYALSPDTSHEEPPAESSRQGLLRAIAQQRRQEEQERERQQSTYNAQLRKACRIYGLDGLQETLKQFRSSGIKPDESTLQIVLDCVRTTTTNDPTRLATVLNALLRHSPDLRPSTDHLDLLLGQAVRARSRDAHMAQSQFQSQTQTRSQTRHRDLPSTLTSDTATGVDIKSALESPAEIGSINAQAGLKPNDPFKKAIQGIIQSLHARGARSASKSLANRLRFEAHSSQSSSPEEDGGPPISAQTVWNDMISRGYKPDKRHLLALMKGYAESGHMQGCEDVILLAKEMEIEVTRGMWMVLMTSYGRRGSLDLGRAEKAFQAIKRSEQGLDPAAVCAMIGIYLRARKRHLASHLALQLVGNLVSDPTSLDSSSSRSFSVSSSSTSSPPRELPSNTESDPAGTSSEWIIPPFPRSQLNDRVIAIASDALRLDHPLCAMEVIHTAYPTKLPTRVRDVVKSIKSRSRSRIKWNVADSGDSELLIQADRILSGGRESVTVTRSTTGWTGHGKMEQGGVGNRGRPLGPAGVKKRLLRLFERKRHNHRGNGGRKVISAKEERRVRHEMISKKQV